MSNRSNNQRKASAHRKQRLVPRGQFFHSAPDSWVLQIPKRRISKRFIIAGCFVIFGLLNIFMLAIGAPEIARLTVMEVTKVLLGLVNLLISTRDVQRRFSRRKT